MRTHSTGIFRRLATIAGILFVLIAAQTATAQETRRGGSNARDERGGRELTPERQAELIQRYPGIDADGDGVVTPEEMRAFFEANPELRRGPRARPEGGRQRTEIVNRFQMILQQNPGLDKDGDGALSYKELMAAEGPEGEAIRTRLRARILRQNPEADTDKYGKLSDEELKAYMTKAEDDRRAALLRRYPEADKDGDGKLSNEELKALNTELEARRRADLLRRHPEADKDGDGKLSDEELKALNAKLDAERRAEILKDNHEADKDGDGKLSDEEWRAFREQNRQRQRGTEGGRQMQRQRGQGRGRGPAAPSAQ
ncbi:MAG: hypothetical protein GXY44_01775 [Phycisphaerales bacterium]|nr:hypothetical protein [Phycisphaerales bacterium]